MGWASAGDSVFNPVTRALIRAEVSESQITEICEDLIGTLSAEDWDTQDESLREFENVPAVVKAFNRHGMAARHQRSANGEVTADIRCMGCDRMVEFQHKSDELISLPHYNNDNKPCVYAGKDPFGW